MASCGMTTSGRPPVHQTKGERLAWEMTTRGSRWIPIWLATWRTSFDKASVAGKSWRCKQ